MVVFGFLEFELRKIPNNYSYKFEELKHSNRGVKTIIFGGSEGFCGLNPSIMDVPAYNACLNSQSIKYNGVVWDMMSPNFTQLRFLVITVSYHNLIYSLERETPKLLKYYDLFFDIKNIPWWDIEDKFLCLDDNMLFSSRRLVNYFRGADSEISSTKLGFATRFSLALRQANWKEQGVELIKKTTYKDSVENLAENLACLNQIIKSCKIKNIKVLLVAPPISKGYYQVLGEKRLSNLMRICTQLENENTNVKYIDLSLNDKFSDGDFFDLNHLNEFGAIKMSKMVNDIIHNN